MKLGKALENYLKAILILKKKQGEQNVRSTDVAAFLEVSKPSVSHAMKVLKENMRAAAAKGFINATD